ncbi:hypothetical protein [Serinibacter salmoneus]|nr:hypothetical protein [Serinibacter salmoneus]
MTTTRPAAVFAAVALSAVLASCATETDTSPGGAEAEATASPDVSTAESLNSEPEAEAPSSSAAGEGLTRADSPLAHELTEAGLASVLEVQTREVEYALRVRQEELLAECMAERGFEYVPEFTAQEAAEQVELPERGTREFAEQIGYDITFLPPESGEIDRNPGSGDGWYEAMNGAALDGEDSFDLTAEESILRSFDHGCSGSVSRTIYAEFPGYGAYSIQLYSRFNDFFRGFTQVLMDAAEDARNAEIEADWAACMAQGGYEFANPGEARASLYALEEDLLAEYHEEFDGEAPSEEEVAEANALEIETAVADYECREQVDYDSRMLAIEFEYEAAHIQENREVLEEYIAAGLAFEEQLRP